MGKITNYGEIFHEREKGQRNTLSLGKEPENKAVENIHAVHIGTKNGEVRKICKWKNQDEVITQCEKYGCTVPPTHIVTWKTKRWYGLKNCASVFCKIHALEWFEYLLESDSQNPTIREI